MISKKWFRKPKTRRARYRISLGHWIAQAIKTAYWLATGQLTWSQAWRIWTRRARLVMRDPYDDMAEFGP